MTEFADGDILDFLNTEHADDVPIGTSNLLAGRLTESPKLLNQVANDLVLLERANELLGRVESSVEQIVAEVHRRRTAKLRSRFFAATSITALVVAGFWVWGVLFPPAQVSGTPTFTLKSEASDPVAKSSEKTTQANKVTELADAKTMDTVGEAKTQPAEQERPNPTTTGTETTQADPPLANAPVVEDGADAHPALIEETRDGHAFRSEVLASLDADDPAEVCTRITTLPNFDNIGVLESTDDDRLFQSVSAFIDSVMTEHPEVHENMVEPFESAGELRFQAAAAESDVAAVRRITMQFMGTSAERLAHQWLGDRALVKGDVTTARQHFRAVLSGRSRTSRELRHQVEARLRLVAALAGSPTVDPENTAFDEVDVFGLSAEDFSEMLGEFGDSESRPILTSQRPSGLPFVGGVKAVAVGPAMKPIPRQVELQRIGEVDVAHVPVAVVRGGGETRDWNGRELGMIAFGDQLVYANKTGVGTLELNKTSTRPKHTPVGETRGIKPDLTGKPFWPAVRGDQVFVKGVPLGPPSLAAVNWRSGKIDWEVERVVASNPFMMAGNLYVVTCQPIDLVPADREPPFKQRKPIRWVRRARPKSIRQVLQVSLEHVDPGTGRTVNTQPLFKIEDKWNQILNCQVSIAGESIVLSLGGAVCCVEPSCPLKWIRIQPWVEQVSAVAVHDRPLISGNDVIVFQPHAKTIDCIRARDGHLRWSAETKGVERLIGVIDNHVLVQSTTELRAIDQASGEMVWELPLIHLTEFFATSGNYLIVGFLERLSDERWRPVLAWIDATTGEPIAEQILKDWTTSSGRAPLPCVGPVVSDGERIFVGYSRDELHRHRIREIWELKVGSSQLPAIPDDSPLRKLKVRAGHSRPATQVDE